MLKMTAQDGVREAIARQALLKQFGAQETTYTTGDAVYVNDANEYTWLLAAQFYPGFNQQNGPAQVYSMAATGTVGSGVVVQIKSSKANAYVLASVASPAKIVDTVRDTFRLTISEAAQVLRISRPTVYQWESLADIEAIRAHHDRDRLKQLYRITLNWSTRPAPRGRWLHAALPGGKSVFDLLSEPILNEIALSQAHDLLVAMAPRLQAEESQRADSAVKALKGAFAKLATNEQKRIQKG